MKGTGLFLLVAAAGTAADLITKHVAGLHLDLPWRPVITVVPDSFDLAWSRNEGAAFGIMRGKLWLFIAISLVAVAMLLYFSATAKPRQYGYQVILGLLTAGVLGNFYDRLALGHVRDFIEWYIGYEPIARRLIGWFGTNHWPSFNLADAFICVGAGALLVKFWRDDMRERRAAAASPAPRPSPSR